MSAWVPPNAIACHAMDCHTTFHKYNATILSVSAIEFCMEDHPRFRICQLQILFRITPVSEARGRWREAVRFDERSKFQGSD